MLSVRALARSITALENNQPAALAALHQALQTIAPGKGLVAGITGPPGAGKSTLVDAMTRELRKRSRSVAILAIDPSSRATGGAILGDRIRMREHHSDPGVYIRSMATRGHSGGLAAATRNVAEWLRANGFDYVLIETVGVGQDEIAVACVADVVAVVLTPGLGDDVQAIKAGVMEIADLFVINKADYEGTARTVHEIEAMLSLAHGPHTRIMKTVATEPRGIRELLDALDTLQRRDHPPAASQFAIDHLAIAVRSLDAALPFYRLLGFPEPVRETLEYQRVAILPAGDSRIELLENTSGEGLQHVALRVPDLAHAVEQLTRAGLQLTNEPRRGAGGNLSVFVHPSGAGGVLWELIQDEGAHSD